MGEELWIIQFDFSSFCDLSLNKFKIGCFLFKMKSTMKYQRRQQLDVAFFFLNITKAYSVFLFFIQKWERHFELLNLIFHRIYHCMNFKIGCFFFKMKSTMRHKLDVAFLFLNIKKVYSVFLFLIHNGRHFELLHLIFDRSVIYHCMNFKIECFF